MRKVCIITANRADYSRLKTVCRAVQQRSAELDLQLIVMGSHLLEKYDYTHKMIEQDGFPISHKIYMELDGRNPVTMTKSVGYGIVELTTALEQLKPDIAVVPVDRFESLAMASTAALMNVPIAHIQGGEVTGTIDESIRHAITKLSHLHFASTEQSRERIIKMGEPEQFVFNVGCPGTDLLLETPVMVRDVLIENVNQITKDPLHRLNPGEPFLLVVYHPVTTEFGRTAQQAEAILEAIKDMNMQIIWLWPNIDAGADDITTAIRHFQLANPTVRLLVFKNFPNEMFINLMRHAACMVGNSSSGIRETCYLGTPTVNIGTRQSGRERGNCVADAPCVTSAIKKAIQNQISHRAYEPEYVYGDGSAGEKIANILASIELPNPQKQIVY